MSNFRRRLQSGFVMLILAVATLIPFNAYWFRVIYVFAVTIAIFELTSAIQVRNWWVDNRNLSIFFPEIIIFFWGGLAIIDNFNQRTIIATCIIALSNDLGAYVIGKTFRHRFFKGAPFPQLSPHKSWEGLIGGAIISILSAILCLHLNLLVGFKQSITTIIVLFGWLFALCGDLLESHCKRILGIKDSSDVLIEFPFFNKLEICVDGHGGFLDVIDSVNFLAFVLFILKLF